MLATSGPASIDLTAMLERCGGDESLLREIAGIFLTEYPSLLKEIQSAAADRDSKRMERAAHTLKGAASNFEAYAVTGAALHLEQLGRQRSFEGVDEGVSRLEAQLSALHPVLVELSEA